MSVVATGCAAPVAGPTSGDGPTAGKADGFDPGPNVLDQEGRSGETDTAGPGVELGADSRVQLVTEAGRVTVQHAALYPGNLGPEDTLTLTVRTPTASGAEASFETKVMPSDHAQAQGVPAETVRDYEYVLWPTPLDQALPDEHVDAFHEVEDEIARRWGDTLCATAVRGCIPGGVNGAHTGCEGETIVSMALSAFQAPELLCADLL
jgi:hypothetical protein